MMILSKKNFFFVVLLTILPFCSVVFGQANKDSYERLWKVIQSDTISKEKQLYYLEVYYRKAQMENNALEAYRSMEKKSYLVPFSEAVEVLQKIKKLVAELENDSLSGDFLNRNVVLYYKHRVFKEALNYAIESEAFNEEINNLYNLNSVRIDIGNIYYHTRNYEKAIIYFTKARDYYKTKSSYNDHRGSVVALYSLGKTYWQLADANSLALIINESKQAISLLKPAHQLFEEAYLSFVKGGLAYLRNDMVATQEYFESALPIIKQNNDFTNEHIIYLYLGKIAWNQNQKEKAIVYFNKIDKLFHEKRFLNYELRETYEYLISYYKETKQPQQQFQATESLIALNLQFEKEQQNITNTLHDELDTKKLEIDKKQMLNQLKNNKNVYGFWLIVFGISLIVLAVYSYRQGNEKKKLKVKFDQLLKKIQIEKTSESNSKSVSMLGISMKSEIIDESVITIKDNFIESESIALKVTKQRLLKQLEQFEKEKRYLNSVKLDDLAEEFGTNRNTLSAIINEHRGSFTNYINKLRIEQLLVDLTKQQKLRKLPITELAELYGFANAKTFSSNFKSETGLTPSYFIKQLELENMH